MGLYEPIKSLFQDDSSPLVKWLSAFTSGAIGSAIFNPIDVLKVRFQSQLPNEPRPYSSLLSAFRTIYAEKGVKGLYIGTSATVTRAAFLTSAQLGSYDVIKNNIFVRMFGMDKEANVTHFSASILASVITTTAANPADVVKTRVMNDPNAIVGGPSKHIIWNENGVRGFMKGWTASYFRIGPHTVISLMAIEKVRQIIGISSY
jgi:hypothetical protein